MGASRFEPGIPAEPAPHRGPSGRQENIRALLAQVIQRTLVTPSPAETVTPEDLSLLREVADRFSGEPFDIDRIAVEMVQAMLGSYFDGWSESPEEWRSVARDVARSLGDDPVLRGRIEALWERLGASAS